MKRIIVSILMPFAVLNAQSQNLVPNPSFETPNAPIDCGIFVSSNFNHSVDDWYVAGGTPDLYATNIDSTCFNHQPFSYYNGPIGIKGSQNPRTGDVFAGLFVYTIPGFNQREYIQVKLSQPLIVTRDYCLEFYVSFPENQEKYTNRIGGLFTTTAVNGGSGVISATPQVESVVFINDTINWIKVSGDFKADQAYEYLTIGNFWNDDSTSTLPNPASSGMPGTYGAFYFIDDVTLQQCQINVVSYGNQDFQMYPNPAVNHVTISGLAGDYNLKIYSSNGTVVAQKDNLSNSQIFNLTDLASGLYILEITTPNGIGRKKLIKR